MKIYELTLHQVNEEGNSHWAKMGLMASTLETWDDVGLAHWLHYAASAMDKALAKEVPLSPHRTWTVQLVDR